MSVMLEHVLQINAPQSLIWSITVDIERWPIWIPTVKSVKRLDAGSFACGSAALIKQFGLPEAKWVVTAIAPEERFTWKSRILGMRMVATHQLSPQETGIQSTLRLEISGLVSAMLAPLIRRPAQKSLARENMALKMRCESQTG